MIKLKNKKQFMFKRMEFYNFIYNKYYNLYLNNYIIDNIDYQQKDYLLRKFWADGTVGCFKLDVATSKHPQGLLVFTPYAVNGWNIYDYPTNVIAVNTRGVRFIPSNPLEVDKEYVIGYAQRNKKSLHFVVDLYAKKIANIEMVIQINLIAQKAPWILGATPENKDKLQAFWEGLISDDPCLLIDLEGVADAKSLISGAPYIIDKLQSYRSELENELREFFGFDNLGVQEKKEHLITAEVESNDEAISLSSNVFFDSLKEFSERIYEVFGYSMPVRLNTDMVDYEYESEDEEEIEDEN